MVYFNEHIFNTCYIIHLNVLINELINSYSIGF